MFFTLFFFNIILVQFNRQVEEYKLEDILFVVHRKVFKTKWCDTFLTFYWFVIFDVDILALWWLLHLVENYSSACIVFIVVFDLFRLKDRVLWIFIHVLIEWITLGDRFFVFKSPWVLLICAFLPNRFAWLHWLNIDSEDFFTEAFHDFHCLFALSSSYWFETASRSNSVLNFVSDSSVLFPHFSFHVQQLLIVALLPPLQLFEFFRLKRVTTGNIVTQVSDRKKLFVYFFINLFSKAVIFLDVKLFVRQLLLRLVYLFIIFFLMKKLR